jgi:hypothetical protein
MVSAEELLTKARYEHEMDEALEGAVILSGAGGPAEGGVCPGFVVVSEKPIASVIGRLRELATELAQREVSVVYSRAHT